jgi:hypothetical protein
LLGEPPPAQVTSQSLTPAQVTLHVPLHRTSHVEAFVQLTVLPGPTSTPQRLACSHVYRQFAPHSAPQAVTRLHLMLQSLPHEAVHSFMP